MVCPTDERHETLRLLQRETSPNESRTSASRTRYRPIMAVIEGAASAAQFEKRVFAHLGIHGRARRDPMTNAVKVWGSLRFISGRSSADPGSDGPR